MGKFHLSTGRKLTKLHKGTYVAIVIVLILVSSQVERFINKGTIFGYQARDIKSQQVISRQNSSGSLIDGSIAAENQKSAACEVFPADKVSKILKSDVERISGFLPDRNDPILVSSCIYRTKGDTKDRRSISILLREQKDVVTAQKTIVALKQTTKGEDLKGVGDEAYFNTTTNQLTVRKDKKLVTVTAPRIQSSGQDNKTIAVEIAKIGL